MEKRVRKKRKKKLWIIVWSIIGILIIGAGSYIYYLFHSVEQAANEMYEPLAEDSNSAKKEREEKLSHQKPISILLMGIDQRKGDVGRSDTLIVMTLNPKNEKMQMVSIPRDTKTEIIGDGRVTKINAAYAYGGVKMAKDTVENFTGVKMDYYIQVNMEALSDLVDAIGGITVQNDLDWIDEGYYKKGYHYEKGTLTLNGPQTLGFVRMRHLDPNGDFGRNERQRKVISAIIDKATGISTVTHFNEILDALGANVKTNITFDQMMTIQKNYRSVRKSVEQYEVTGQGTPPGQTYYLNVPDEEKAKVHDMLTENLK
ncbi:transcriptional regulator LytR [Niallia circulans]|jgi:polyisoprenyl-teichoic acid--peptidoglycan teichoic acid transferase|uniref:Transcriptional regulator LytR n=1 Tax=Niallia circulans TaxID=1397 RepID=A0A0J1KZ60_NIACI|nr:LCP family protein [Niallia circulans]KLV22065.1 transcriptional regulator LytR [Niallia circulans]MCM2983216.1 LCP family protein [Niallia circulans]NRG33727.1 LCP family protein [Niallia circulans]PAD23872.1 transcriptional regulator LytR [Niallia circulans]PAD86122.1 transcriptional regulator LytR [Niallia circulans]